jgi:F-type H+-transporting ATPase subunit alpha
MVELLKQPQFAPMDVELQIVSIYAGTKGFFDSLPTEDVADFEKGLHAHLKSKYKEALQAIVSTGKLEKATEETLGKAIQEFKDQFVKEHVKKAPAAAPAEAPREAAREKPAAPAAAGAKH